MSWIQVIGAVLQIIIWILNAIKEKNDESKKSQTEIIQSGVRGLIDRNASRIVDASDRMRRMRGL
jgi:hypothetical protein